MRTPICDFVREYAQKGMTRLHMPGHKGAGEAALDITEVEGADVLYSPTGIIRESQENAARLFGAAKTLYSTEGSSLAIRAMLYLLRLRAGKNCTVAAARNAHKTFVTAAGLLDIRVQWLWPRKYRDLLSCPITPGELTAFLDENRVDAVYITSPDYLGNLAPARALAEVCHAHGCLLLVDNAHGAYLRFLEKSLHPMQLGADLCCDSAHKTLPVLTGGAYLHISPAAPKEFLEQAENAMSVFASTSPSYLILQSLDRANLWLAEDGRRALADCVDGVRRLKTALSDAGWELVGEEPMKLTLATKAYGYRADKLGQLLRKHQIEAEFSDPDYLVLMPSPQNGSEALKHLERVLLSIPKAAPIAEKMPSMERPEQVLSLHEAMLRPGKELPIEACVGRLLASPTVSCPPAVPVLVCGERVREDALEVLRYYGTKKLNAILEG